MLLFSFLGLSLHVVIVFVMVVLIMVDFAVVVFAVGVFVVILILIIIINIRQEVSIPHCSEPRVWRKQSGYKNYNKNIPLKKNLGF